MTINNSNSNSYNNNNNNNNNFAIKYISHDKIT